MAWQDHLAGLGLAAEREMEALVKARERGVVDDERFVILAAALIARWAGRAIVAADLAVAVTLASDVAGVPVEVNQSRLRDAVTTVLDPDTAPERSQFDDLAESQAFRLGRLAKSETLDHGQDATQKALDRQGVMGWVRQTDADPCQLCQGWADGVVRPMSVRMKRHNGCACIPRPAPLA